MRVSCSQKSLAKGISIVSRAVASRSTLSILANILIEARDQYLRLASTNLELGINCWIPAEVQTEGSITVPVKLFGDLIGKLSDESIELRLTDASDTLHVKSARTHAKIKGLPSADFPIVQTVSSVTKQEDGKAAWAEAQITGETLRNLIKQVSFAASTESTRPTLTGMEVKFVDNQIAMAATDGYRLGIRSAMINSTQTLPETVFVVPSKSMDEVSRICMDGDKAQPVSVFVPTDRTNNILFAISGRSESNHHFHRVEIVTQLLEGKFPTYQAIIPKEYTTSVTLQSAEFYKAIKIASLFVKDSANNVRLAIKPAQNRMDVIAVHSEQGDNVTELDADVNGDQIEISFNAQYLMDILDTIQDEEVTLKATQATRPITLCPVNMEEKEFLHVIMPMHTPR